MEKDRFCPSIMTEWMENGSLQYYLKAQRDADKLSLVSALLAWYVYAALTALRLKV